MFESPRERQNPCRKPFPHGLRHCFFSHARQIWRNRMIRSFWRTCFLRLSVHILLTRFKRLLKACWSNRLSANLIFRFVLQHTNQSIGKLLHSKNLISTNYFSFSQISETCGFSEVSDVLYKVFKSETGTTPKVLYFIFTFLPATILQTRAAVFRKRSENILFSGRLRKDLQKQAFYDTIQVPQIVPMRKETKEPMETPCHKAFTTKRN